MLKRPAIRTRTKIIAKVSSSLRPGIKFRFPYPTGEWGGDGCDWSKNDLHSTAIVKQSSQSVTLERKIDSTTYYIAIEWEGKADFREKAKNYFVLEPQENTVVFTCSLRKNGKWFASGYLATDDGSNFSLGVFLEERSRC